MRDGETSRLDAGLGVLLLLSAALLLGAAMQLPAGASSDPLGPRGFPALLALALAACGIAVLGDALRRPSSARPSDEDSGPFSTKLFTGATLLSAAYVVVLVPVGFLLATPAYMAGLALLQRGMRLWQLLLLAFGFPLMLFALFSIALGVSLPPGVLEPILLR